MNSPGYDLFGILLALVCGVLVIGAVIQRSMEIGFPTRSDLKSLAYIVAWALFAPLLYWWGAPVRMTVADAYLLSVTVAGWTFVAMGYAALLGLLAGLLIALVINALPRK